MKPTLGPRDVHIVINTLTDRAKCFVPGESEPRWTVSAHNEGVRGPGFDRTYGDTPPGLWLITAAENIPPSDPDANAFGPVYFYMQPVAGDALLVDRPGVGWHGGGSGLPSPRAPRQGWQVTHGCLRSQNQDLIKHVEPTVRYVLDRGGRVWVTVSRDEYDRR